MACDILKGEGVKAFSGCDFVVRLSEDRKNTEIKILQLTDMQVIDSSQRRRSDRIRADEICAWDPKNFDIQCGNHIRSLIAAANPDLIIITGDIVYGEFDDAGSTLKWICSLMDSFKIPWAPVFGNHDNESKMGVAWQCARFTESKYCLFRRGEVSGNCNYSVGVAVGDELVRVIHMLDSNGCKHSEDPSVIKEAGIFADQMALIKANTESVRLAQGKDVPAFMAFHIPVTCFADAEMAKGYRTEMGEHYTLGVDVCARDGDFGFNHENHPMARVEDGFIDFLHGMHIDGVFVGHFHKACTCISYEGIRWVFGLKTGQYDYHEPGQLGATLITLFDKRFSVLHLPSLVHYAPMPKGAKMFNGLFAE